MRGGDRMNSPRLQLQGAVRGPRTINLRIQKRAMPWGGQPRTGFLGDRGSGAGPRRDPDTVRARAQAGEPVRSGEEQLESRAGCTARPGLKAFRRLSGFAERRRIMPPIPPGEPFARAFTRPERHLNISLQLQKCGRRSGGTAPSS